MSILSQAAQVIISIIPIVGIVLGCVVVFFYLLWHHKDKKLLIERGLYEPVRFDLDLFCLLGGLVLSMVGFVLTLLFIIIDGITYSLLGGAIPFAIGLALIAFYALRRARSGT